MAIPSHLSLATLNQLALSRVDVDAPSIDCCDTPGETEGEETCHSAGAGTSTCAEDVLLKGLVLLTELALGHCADLTPVLILVEVLEPIPLLAHNVGGQLCMLAVS